VLESPHRWKDELPASRVTSVSGTAGADVRLRYEVAFIAATRGALGFGAGLLLSQKFSDSRTLTVVFTLALTIGATTAVNYWREYAGSFDSMAQYIVRAANVTGVVGGIGFATSAFAARQGLALDPASALRED